MCLSNLFSVFYLGHFLCFHNDDVVFFVSTAIQFVLSDEFSHLRPEQRLALLHVSKVPLYKNGLLVTS